MGLFGGKKDPCPVCGGEVTGLFKTKIKDGALCRSCADRVALPKETLKKADVPFIKEHLAFRENEAKLFSVMTPTHKFTFGSSFTLTADDTLRMLAIGDTDFNSSENPIVLRYDEVKTYALYKGKKKLDDHTMPGSTVSQTMTSVLNTFMHGKDAPAEDYTIKLTTTHPYWPVMDIFLLDVDHPEFHGYKNNMGSMAHLIKCIVRKEPFVMEY